MINRVSLDKRFSVPERLFFVIGAQKSATSWLDDYLRARPEVCLPVHKEVHYWSLALDQNKKGNHFSRLKVNAARSESVKGLLRKLVGKSKPRKDLAWRLERRMFDELSSGHEPYADVLFQDYAGEPVLGEMSPTYALLDRKRFAEMRSLNPNVLFIFVMRDPVDRFVSGIRHQLRQVVGKKLTVDIVEKEILDTLQKPDHPALALSRYDLTLTELRSAVEETDILVLFYEDLFLTDAIVKLERLLGIPAGTPDIEKTVHAGAGREIELTSEVLMEVHAQLISTYGYVEDYFHGYLPKAWRYWFS